MSEQYNGRKLTRWDNHDYSVNAWYHVVICTKDRICHFGSVIDHKMHLSNYGKIAEDRWRAIPVHHPFVMLDEFIVMPDHIHGIVAIGDDASGESVGKTPAFSLPVAPVAAQRLPFEQRRNVRQHEQLPIIIGSYKSGVSKLIHRANNSIEFQWQTSYYDHIIRDQHSLDAIRHYIRNNPAKWKGTHRCYK